ncbi:DUF4383 domain-containing protein [Micromonospora sp. L5]|uniref:DUF4383 domain-containing protein n=1 Tax=Micromonospora sp. (strain L5) TaxID=648999 RepID=UPI002101C506|nr:DUF4383 domain-containing protein [Micromonospora sp. L5]
MPAGGGPAVHPGPDGTAVRRAVRPGPGGRDEAAAAGLSRTGPAAPRGRAGLAIDGRDAANVLAVNRADSWLHLLLGAAMLALGLVATRRGDRR